MNTLLQTGLSGVLPALKALLQQGVFAVEWQRPWALVLLPVVVIAVVVAVIRDRQRPTLRFARGDDLARLPRGLGPIFRLASLWLGGAAAALLLFALAGPFVRGEPDPASTDGIDIVIALDISGSMRAADFRPKDRLFVAKIAGDRTTFEFRRQSLERLDPAACNDQVEALTRQSTRSRLAKSPRARCADDQRCATLSLHVRSRA